MTKLLIEVKDSGPRIDTMNGQQLAGFRPNIVDNTPFIAALIEDGEIEVLLEEVGSEIDNDRFGVLYLESPEKALAAVKAGSETLNRVDPVTPPTIGDVAKGRQKRAAQPA